MKNTTTTQNIEAVAQLLSNTTGHGTGSWLVAIKWFRSYGETTATIISAAMEGRIDPDRMMAAELPLNAHLGEVA